MGEDCEGPDRGDEGAPRHPASFRDPSGFLFRRDGVLLRQVNRRYQEHLERLESSGLGASLQRAGLLIAHEVLPASEGLDDEAVAVLRPEEVPFVTYPYEWSFSMLRDAALLTLDVQRRALKKGMTLKDASAYNVQFHRGRPVLVDSLSFERYQEGRPWVAYRQFCQHFLAPLALMARRDVRLLSLLRVHMDGVPLDLAGSLLPASTFFRPSLLMHVHLHAAMQRRHAGTEGAAASERPEAHVSRNGMLGLVASLRGAVEALRWTPAGTEWADYTSTCAYSESSRGSKRELVGRFLDRIEPATVWDLGANTGEYSFEAVRRGAHVVAMDVDPGCVERCYRQVREQEAEGPVPLLVDLMNPPARDGWGHRERRSLADRGPVDLVLALALIHHLSVARNVPLDEVARWLARLARHLVIEWVPKEDPQVQRLLASREDVFPRYHRPGFEEAFAGSFEVLASEEVEGTGRRLYCMEARG